MALCLKGSASYYALNVFLVMTHNFFGLTLLFATLINCLLNRYFNSTHHTYPISKGVEEIVALKAAVAASPFVG